MVKIRENMQVRLLNGTRGQITKTNTRKLDNEIWYDLRIKLDDAGDRFGDVIGNCVEWHGFEKDMYKRFESVGNENLQVVSTRDFRMLQTQVEKLTKTINYLKGVVDGLRL